MTPPFWSAVFLSCGWGGGGALGPRQRDELDDGWCCQKESGVIEVLAAENLQRESDEDLNEMKRAIFKALVLF